MSEAIHVSELTGGYGSLRIFWGVSFAVARGKTIGMYGPNGAGKTTLLRTIVGLLPAIEGAVTLDGKDVTNLPAYKRVRSGLALVPEGRQIIGGLTVEDNLQLVRAAWERSDQAEFEEKMIEVFELFPKLKERARQMAGSLSGGEQQMLAIGRAVLVRPVLLMLDEPTQGLAPIVVKELAGALSALKTRVSMIIVEQNRDFLDGLVDSQYEMHAGLCRPARAN